MNGLELAFLRWRVKRKGFVTTQFNYHSVTHSIEANVTKLAAFVHKLDSSSVHFVAHSLGGLVVLRLFEEFPDLPHGRIVLLGSPVRGSKVARILTGIKGGTYLLGKSANAGLVQDRDPYWDGRRDLGVIAGTLGLSVVRLLHRLEGPNDGTIAVEETHIDGMKDFLTLNVTHTTMVFSPQVANEIAHFLDYGHFSTTRQTSGSVS